MEKENASYLLYKFELKLLFYLDISTLLKMPFIGTRSLIKRKKTHYVFLIILYFFRIHSLSLDKKTEFSINGEVNFFKVKIIQFVFKACVHYFLSSFYFFIKL